MAKEYLGDSVYVDFDGFWLKLTTENDTPEDPSNVIVLEPPVLTALSEYIARLNAVYAEHLKTRTAEAEANN